jgi:hypothetical protein
MIVSGRAEMAPDSGTPAAAQLDLRYRLATQVADGYAGAGFTAVLRDVVLGPELARYVDMITTRLRYLVDTDLRS